MSLYCRDNEHARYIAAHGVDPAERKPDTTTYRPFEGLAGLLKKWERCRHAEDRQAYRRPGG